jgi:hypothetical protein
MCTTILIMKSSIFCSILPSSPPKVNRRFRGTHSLHPQSWRIRQTRISIKAGGKLSRWFLARLILQPSRQRWHDPLKCWFTINTLYSVISQKKEPFIATAEILKSYNPYNIERVENEMITTKYLLALATQIQEQDNTVLFWFRHAQYSV